MTQAQTQDHDLVSRAIAVLADWFKGSFRRLAEEREWQSLDRPERGRIAHDLGMTSSALDTLIAESGGSAELDDVLGRTGLRQTAAMYGALHDMQRVCGLCQARGECRDWLSIPAEARDDAVTPYFCPNREELKLLHEMQHGSCAK
ncbi:MAG: DUF6455 family protein [Ferrovibrio sp.]|uniref:DUF6455 family protein n=1 Tax=Ferrovibrio sp. TaxID=1917215 RepID=UPI002631E7C5|nr:DUF6455 family protein [Ferrovibrio sp.]MCW0233261.1 DUF6455 family protein [Ferrovibrio sp.]